MPPKRKKTTRPRSKLAALLASPSISRAWPMALVTAAVMLVLSAASMAVGASLEEKDTFCASCHSQPESTYYQRSTASSPVDLASAHKSKTVKCIDCHSGAGFGGRMQAFYVGGGDLLHWITRTAIQPAPLIHPIPDGNCTKCHGATEATQDFNRHFHAFLPRWQAVDQNAARCVNCHTAHPTDGDPGIVFLNQTHTEAVCSACHQALRGGE
jgi:hypothetical protein